MKKLIGLFAVVAFLALPGAAMADDRTCTGVIGPEIVQGNVLVSEHASCTLAGTVVTGSVEAKGGSELTAINVTVHGNLKADQVDELAVSGDSFFFGSIQSKFSVKVSVDDARVIGNTEFTEGIGDGNLTVTNNSVDGSMLVNKNMVPSTVSGNSVGGNLSCFDNTPPPVAFGNFVRGNTEGQCQEAF